MYKYKQLSFNIHHLEVYVLCDDDIRKDLVKL